MTTELRILTVRQPWSEAIIFGGKDVENRVTNVAGSFRGTVAIHSAKRPATPAEWRAFEIRYPSAMSQMMDTVPWSQEEFGVIIGLVDLVGVHYSGVDGCGTGEGEGPIPMCSDWCEPIAHHLVLANPRPVAEPIPYKGALGLRRLDDETIARVTAQDGA